MFRKCYLHVGNPHAGSTSIQAALSNGSAALLEHGYVYPAVGRNHGALAADMAPNSRRAKAILSGRDNRAGDPDADLDAICKEFRAEFEREIAGTSAHTLLLSSEFFVTLPTEDLVKLGAYLGQFAEELTVVCYVRHPYSDYMARLQHRLKRGLARLEDFPRDKLPSNLPERLDRLVEAFGRERVVFRPFDRAQLYRNDAVSDFLHVVGAPEALIDRIDTPTLNASPSHEATMIADALMGLGVGAGGHGKADPKQMRLLALIHSSIRGTRLGFDDEWAAVLLADSRSQVERMRQDHGVELSEPKLTMANERWRDETLADLAEVIWELASRSQRAQRRGKAQGERVDEAPTPAKRQRPRRRKRLQGLGKAAQKPAE